MTLGAMNGGVLSGTLRNDAYAADLAGRTELVPTEVDVTIHAARSGSVVEQGAALRALDRAMGDPRMSEALVRGDAEAKPVGAARPAETCTVEVRFTPVMAGANHAFIVTTDSDSVDYFRGGPQAKNTGMNSPSSGSADGQKRSTFDPRYGAFGPIVTESGAYTAKTIDWTTKPSGQQTVTRTAGSCDNVNKAFTRHLDDIEAAGIDYTPLNANSNSVVRETLERAGFRGVAPVVWAPAWHTQLPDPR